MCVRVCGEGGGEGSREMSFPGLLTGGMCVSAIGVTRRSRLEDEHAIALLKSYESSLNS